MLCSVEICATLCRMGELIRLLTSALTVSLQRRIALLHQAPLMIEMERRHLSWQREGVAEVHADIDTGRTITLNNRNCTFYVSNNGITKSMRGSSWVCNPVGG